MISSKGLIDEVAIESKLTEEIGEPLRLIVMFNGHADGVEEHKDDDEPVELLRLDGIAYPEPESLFGPPELQTRALLLHFRLEVGRSRESYKIERTSSA